MSNETHCVHCEATEEVDNGIVLGQYDGQTTCNICLSSHYGKNTLLSGRESDVAALKQLRPSFTHGKIGSVLDVEKSTVDTVVSRVVVKINKSKTLANEEFDELLNFD